LKIGLKWIADCKNFVVPALMAIVALWQDLNLKVMT